MKQLTRYLSALLLALSMAGNAQAVSLWSLIDPASQNKTITVEDKLFSDFWWDDGSNTSLDGINFTGSLGLLDSITVTGLPSTPGLLNPGLNFSTDALSVTSNGLYEWIDLFFGFKVTVIDTVLGPDLFIKDTSLALTSGSRTLAGDNGHYIREQVGTSLAAVSDILGDGDLGTQDVEVSFLDGDLMDPQDGDLDIFKLTDAAAFAPQKEVYVSKNILVWADSAGGNNPVSTKLNGFDQRFSQTTTTVPEPETWLLLSVGLMGFVFNLKRRKTI